MNVESATLSRTTVASHPMLVRIAAAIRVAVAMAQPGDLVLVVGKGHMDWQEVGDGDALGETHLVRSMQELEKTARSLAKCPLGIAPFYAGSLRRRGRVSLGHARSGQNARRVQGHGSAIHALDSVRWTLAQPCGLPSCGQSITISPLPCACSKFEKRPFTMESGSFLSHLKQIHDDPAWVARVMQDDV